MNSPTPPPRHADGPLRDVLADYLARHPEHSTRLAPLTHALAPPHDGNTTSSAPSPPVSVTCTALVIDRDRHILNISKTAGIPDLPTATWGPEDRSFLATAVRAVQHQTVIPPAQLCLTPKYMDNPVGIALDANGGHPRPADPAGPTEPGKGIRVSLTFAFYLAPAAHTATIAAGQWTNTDQVAPPALHDTLAGLDGRAVPLNASVLIHNDKGEYLLHLRDMKPGIWAPGCWALLGGAREPQDLTLDGTVRRELKEEAGLVPQHIEPFATETAISPDGLAIPLQIYAARWNGDPTTLHLTEGVMLAWFPPSTLPRLRLGGGTLDLVQRHSLAEA